MKKLLLNITIIMFILSFPASALAATLSLVPATGTANRGCNFAVNIELDTTGAATDGTDAILKYESSKLLASSVTEGSIYPDYPGTNIDPANNRITISGLAAVNQAFIGRGVLATINFTVPPTAPTGATSVTFDFDPNDKTKTTDSNVVERNTVIDVLSSIGNGNYTIGSGTCASQTLTTTPGIAKGAPSATSSGSLPTKSGTADTSLPEAGTEQLTYTLVIVGSILTILGILGLVLL